MTEHPVMARARPAPRRRQRLSKTANARDTLSEFGRGIEVDILTFGQFSISDAVEAVLERTGPAHVAISTWTAASADLTRTARHLHDERIQSLRLLVDRSFLTRQPEYARTCLALFGEAAIRTSRIHAKFCLVHNDAWHVVMRTSMNLNENPRLEYLQVVDDADLCAWYLSVIDEIFKTEDPGLGGKRGTPELVGLESYIPTTIQMGRTVKMGHG